MLRNGGVSHGLPVETGCILRGLSHRGDFTSVKVEPRWVYGEVGDFVESMLMPVASARRLGLIVSSQKRFSKKFRLLTLLILVALCAFFFSAVRIFLYPAVPTTIVHGRIVYGLDGNPAGMAVVHAQMVKPLNGQPYGNGRVPRYGRVIADMNGCYTMPKMEAGTFNIWAEQSGFTVVALDSLLCDGTTTAADLSLIRGGVITGRVIDAATGQPAKREGPIGAHIGLYGPSRPKSGAAIDSAPLQDDGTFFIRAAPGRNFVYVPWARANELSSAWVDVAEGQTIKVELKVSTKRGKQEAEP